MVNEPKKRILNKKEKGLNRHWKNYRDTEYLGSHNLEKGEEALLTIVKFEGEEMVTSADGKSSPKQVLYFKEEMPKMIMNVTNGNTIAALYGSHPDAWIGRQILVHAASVKAFGKTQDALRIRDIVPKNNMDISPYTSLLKPAENLNDLKMIWSKFPESARNNKDLIAFKDELKTKLN